MSLTDDEDVNMNDDIIGGVNDNENDTLLRGEDFNTYTVQRDLVRVYDIRIAKSKDGQEVNVGFRSALPLDKMASPPIVPVKAAKLPVSSPATTTSSLAKAKKKNAPSSSLTTASRGRTTPSPLPISLPHAQSAVFTRVSPPLSASLAFPTSPLILLNPSIPTNTSVAIMHDRLWSWRFLPLLSLHNLTSSLAMRQQFDIIITSLTGGNPARISDLFTLADMSEIKVGVILRIFGLTPASVESMKEEAGVYIKWFSNKEHNLVGGLRADGKGTGKVVERVGGGFKGDPTHVGKSLHNISQILAASPPAEDPAPWSQLYRQATLHDIRLQYLPLVSWSKLSALFPQAVSARDQSAIISLCETICTSLFPRSTNSAPPGEAANHQVEEQLVAALASRVSSLATFLPSSSLSATPAPAVASSSTSSSSPLSPLIVLPPPASSSLTVQRLSASALSSIHYLTLGKGQRDGPVRSAQRFSLSAIGSFINSIDRQLTTSTSASASSHPAQPQPIPLHLRPILHTNIKKAKRHRSLRSSDDGDDELDDDDDDDDSDSEYLPSSTEETDEYSSDMEVDERRAEDVITRSKSTVFVSITRLYIKSLIQLVGKAKAWSSLGPIAKKRREDEMTTRLAKGAPVVVGYGGRVIVVYYVPWAYGMAKNGMDLSLRVLTERVIASAKLMAWTLAAKSSMGTINLLDVTDGNVLNVQKFADECDTIRNTPHSNPNFDPNAYDRQLARANDGQRENSLKRFEESVGVKRTEFTAEQWENAHEFTFQEFSKISKNTYAATELECQARLGIPVETVAVARSNGVKITKVTREEFWSSLTESMYGRVITDIGVSESLSFDLIRVKNGKDNRGNQKWRFRLKMKPYIRHDLVLYPYTSAGLYEVSSARWQNDDLEQRIKQLKEAGEESAHQFELLKEGKTQEAKKNGTKLGKEYGKTAKTPAPRIVVKTQLVFSKADGTTIPTYLAQLFLTFEKVVDADNEISFTKDDFPIGSDLRMMSATADLIDLLSPGPTFAGVDGINVLREMCVLYIPRSSVV